MREREGEGGGGDHHEAKLSLVYCNEPKILCAICELYWGFSTAKFYITREEERN